MEKTKIQEITIYTDGKDIKIETELKEVTIEMAEHMLNNLAAELMRYFNKDMEDTRKFYNRVIFCNVVAIAILFATVMWLLCK